MKKLDEKLLIYADSHGFYLSAPQICDIMGCSNNYVYDKLNGIKEQIDKGRYNRYALLDGGQTKVNIYVFYDYLKYQKILNDKNASKYAPEFNPAEIAAMCPVAVREIVVDMEDAPDWRKTV